MAKKKTTTKRKKADIKMSDKLDKKFSELYGERFGDEKITDVNVADADLEYSQLFGANKNLYRAIPHLISGFKPGKTRCYYNWWEMSGRPQNTKPETLKKLKQFKVDVLASSTVVYHPHSTDSMDDMIGADGQYWNNNVMYLVPEGAYGNIRGDRVAAGRYITAKLSEYMIDCFFDDFDNYCIPMKLAYTGDKEEPVFLPSKYPNILFNPQFSSVGWGLCSNIPPFNFNEVIDATIKLIKDPKSKIMLVPDIPTGCDVVDEGNFKAINKTGDSKITMRASYNIDYVNNIIHITSIPYNESTAGIIDKIIKLKKEKGLFEEISAIDDSTVEGEVKLDLFLSGKPGKPAQPDKVLDMLFKKDVGLRTTQSVDIVVIDDFQAYSFGVKDLLLTWIEYRIDMVRSMYLNKYQKALERQHLNEVLLFVFNKDNIDTTIKIARTSKSRKETAERLMKTFKITSVQAYTIADMHVYNFNEDSYEKYKEDKKKIKEEVKEIESILEDDDKLKEVIINQLKEGKKKYGRPRMSKIIRENDDDKSDIKDTEHLLGISETGYIKKISTKNESIGSIGKTNSSIVALRVSNREDIIIIDSLGYLTKVPVSSIPDMEFSDIGVELSKFYHVNGSVKSVIELMSLDVLENDDPNMGIIFITRQGLAKRVKLSDFKKLTSTKAGIKLNTGDELEVVVIDFNSTAKDIIVFTNKGYGIRLPKDEIPTQSAIAKGNKILSLDNDEYITGASLVDAKNKYVFYITDNGKGKLTELKTLPRDKRNGEKLILMKLDPSDSLIGVQTVSINDKALIYTKKSSPEIINIKDIPVTTRIAKGKKIIKSSTKGDRVVGYKIFK